MIFSLQVDNDIKRFLVVSKSDLEDRMDVDLWINKINSKEQVDLKQCPYNLETLLGN